MKLTLTAAQLKDTFAQLRRCGAGCRECEVVWTGPWSHPHTVTNIVHPTHRPLGDGFQLDAGWLQQFWLELARTRCGIRAQVHTHPGRAFHSPTDDAWPIVHSPGFLSLVIPRFALGPVSLDESYLTTLNNEGQWTSLDPMLALEVT